MVLEPFSVETLEAEVAVWVSGVRANAAAHNLSAHC